MHHPQHVYYGRHRRAFLVGKSFQNYKIVVFMARWKRPWTGDGIVANPMDRLPIIEDPRSVASLACMLWTKGVVGSRKEKLRAWTRALCQRRSTAAKGEGKSGEEGRSRGAMRGDGGERNYYNAMFGKYFASRFCSRLKVTTLCPKRKFWCSSPNSMDDLPGVPF
jgi:hypothetical protein